MLLPVLPVNRNAKRGIYRGRNHLTRLKEPVTAFMDYLANLESIPKMQEML
jgi:hypothetical protein